MEDKKESFAKIEGITIATFNMDSMLAFYSNLFDVEFETTEMFGSTLYSGVFGSLKLLFCPAEVAGNTAAQNRHQLDIIVSDLDEKLEKVTEFGGEIMGDVSESVNTKAVGIYDPDKNSMTLKQLR